MALICVFAATLDLCEWTNEGLCLNLRDALWFVVASSCVAGISFPLLCAAHVVMVVERNPTERKVVGAVAVERARRLVGGRQRAASKTDPKERNPWLTPTESCASDDPELGLSDPVGEDVSGSDSRHKLQECLLICDAGLRRGKVTNSVVGSFHVILLGSHFDDTNIATEQFHVSDEPLNSELECRIKERQSDEQCGGLLSRDSLPRSRVAL